MDRGRALLQLRLVRAVLAGERKRGRLTADLRRRALEIVDRTLVDGEGSENAELTELAAAVRAEIDAD